MPEDAERQRQMQSPNRAEVWSRSQQARDQAMSGPRFEQTIMEFQVSFSFLRGGMGRWRKEGFLGRWIGWSWGEGLDDFADLRAWM